MKQQDLFAYFTVIKKLPSTPLKNLYPEIVNESHLAGKQTAIKLTTQKRQPS